MADEHQVPPAVEQSEDRITSRDYDSDFARLPEHETHPVTDMGSGPSGPVATTNQPIIVMAIGGVIALLVFVFQSVWVLVLGLAIFIGGAVWAGIANRGPGAGGGVGPTVVEPPDTEPSDAETPDTEPPDAETPDAEPPDAEPPDKD